MLIAQQKRKENITEYLIYMFQVEDMIRAFKLDINLIEQHIVSRYDQPYEVKREILEWYKALISMMKGNNNIQKGHIPILETLIRDLNDIHQSILSNGKNTEYIEIYNEAKPSLEELKIKSGEPGISDIKAGLNGVYGFLILKIGSKKINPETESSINQITALLAHLGHEYHKIEKGETEFLS